MKYRFKPKSQIVLVEIKLSHHGKECSIPAALDTGAAFTVIDPDLVRYLDIDPSKTACKTKIVTATKPEFCPSVMIEKVSCLGRTVKKLRVICHRLPKETNLQGLLGGDFLSHFDIRINYRKGFVELV